MQEHSKPWSRLSTPVIDREPFEQERGPQLLDPSVSVPDARPRTTVFLITVNSSERAFAEEALRHQVGTPFRLESIENVAPMAAAFNEMIRRCTTDFFIQVDEDMELFPSAVRDMEASMIQAIQRNPVCYQVCHNLRDPALGRIQGVKIYNHALIAGLSWKPVVGCDRLFNEEAANAGLKRSYEPKEAGYHARHRNAWRWFLKYAFLGQKVRRFDDPAPYFGRLLAGAAVGQANELLAVFGFCLGILADFDEDFTKYPENAYHRARSFLAKQGIGLRISDPGTGEEATCHEFS